MSRFTYTIDDDFVVRIYDSNSPTENGAPNILQDFNPHKGVTIPFADRAEAEAWALDVIDRHVNPDNYKHEIVEVVDVEAEETVEVQE